MAGPQFLRFCRPVVEVLREMGDRGRSRDVQDLVIVRLNISEEEQQQTNKVSGQSKVRNQIAWARMYLVHAGVLDSNSPRGIWELTEAGKTIELTDERVQELFKIVQSKHANRKKNESDQVIAETNAEDDSTEPQDYKTELIDVLKNISPYAFEKFCRRLLLATEFEQVEVTSQSNDKGLDGHAVFNLNTFVKYKVFFQCKRYKDTVGPDTVRDFRGALIGRAARGMIITTGYFTTGATQEANRDGAEPIQLVDGDELVELCAKHRLGLSPKFDFDIDREYFDQFEK